MRFAGTGGAVVFAVVSLNLIVFKVTKLFVFVFMIVLAGTSGAVVVAVVGVLAGFFGSSGINKYGGFTGSGQPRAREMGSAE